MLWLRRGSSPAVQLPFRGLSPRGNLRETHVCAAAPAMLATARAPAPGNEPVLFISGASVNVGVLRTSKQLCQQQQARTFLAASGGHATPRVRKEEARMSVCEQACSLSGVSSLVRRSISNAATTTTTSSGEQGDIDTARTIPFPAVSSVDPAAGEREDSILRMSQEGEWEGALDMLRSIRDAGMKPSMAAYMNVTSACRRALQWDHASNTYREMVEAHLGANLFEDFACEDYEDESEHSFSRACSVVVSMKASNDIEPNLGTYRPLLQLCKDEGSWEAAILLWEYSRRCKTKVNIFIFDLLISTVAMQGYEEVSTMMYEMGVVEADRELIELESDGGNVGGDGQAGWPMWPLEVGSKGGAILELHDLTQSIALATVQVALLDVVRRPEHRPFWGGKKRFRIITGMGNNSKDGEAVIKPAVVEMLDDLGLNPEFQLGNEGCIELKQASLEAYAKRIKSGAAAPATAPV